MFHHSKLDALCGWPVKPVNRTRINGLICRERDALNLLNEDCWEEILNRVEEPDDLRRCSEVCPLFQKILRPKKNAFLFPLILPLIKRHLTNNYEEYKPLLKCRLVCKAWCHSLDKLRQYDYLHVFERSFDFKSGERTEKFLKMFANHKGNPFRGRRVTLHHRSPITLAEAQAEARNVDREIFHSTKMLQLLERFGRKMTLIDLFTHRGDLAFCNNLQRILAHSPNLHNLRVFNTPDSFNLELDQDPEEISCIDANSLSVPTHPVLENLSAHGVNPEVMTLIVEKYAINLKSLVVCHPTGFPEGGLRSANLETLRLDSLDAVISLHGLRQLEAPRLKCLNLSVTRNNTGLELWPIDELFRNIEHLPIQRLDIFLTVENVFVGESGSISAEQWPQHKSISSVDVTYPRGSVSFNFLLYCPKLTRIFLAPKLRRRGVTAGCPSGVTELLDLNDLMEQDDYELYHSNIWEAIPNLSLLSRRNFRGTWEAFRRVGCQKPIAWKWEGRCSGERLIQRRSRGQKLPNS